MASWLVLGDESTSFSFGSNSFDYLNHQENQHRNLLLSDPSVILGTFGLVFFEIVSCGSNFCNQGKKIPFMIHLITKLTRSVITIYRTDSNLISCIESIESSILIRFFFKERYMLEEGTLKMTCVLFTIFL